MKHSWFAIVAVTGIVLGILSAPTTIVPGAANAESADVQDDAFTLHGGAARVTDTTASDDSVARVANTGLGWNIQYHRADFSALVTDQPYEVSFRVKVEHAVASPSGDAFSVGAYDGTAGQHLLPNRTISAASTADDTWAEYSIGIYVPTASANTISFYVASGDNASQISTVSVDSLSFTPYKPHVIEDDDFVLYNGVQRQHEPTAADGSVARLENGSTPSWDVQADVDGDAIDADTAYTVTAAIRMERTDYLGSSGEMFTMGVYDATAGVHLIPPHTFESPRDDENAKYNFVWTVALPSSVELDPTHVNRVFFAKVDNAAEYSAVLVDQVTLSRAATSDAIPQQVSAYPYQISAGSSAGINDGTTISFSVPGTQAITVRILDGSNNVVRTLLADAAVTETGSAYWDGDDGAGAPVAAGTYTARVSYGSTTRDVSIRSVQGVTLATAPDLHPEEEFPLGVWYEGAIIPKNVTDATAYTDTTFADIAASGANDVIISNFDVTRPAVTSAILDQAAEHGLTVVVNPRWWDVIYSDPVNSDEFAMQARVQAIVDQLKPKSAFGGYLLYDEPPHANDKLRETIGKLKKLVETADPDHAVMVDLSGAHSADKYFSELGLQAMTSDPYGALWGKPAGDYTDLGYPGIDYEVLLDFLHLQTKKDISSSAPFWTILQAFEQPGWYRDPSDAEIRSMTYEAVGHGAKGFHYFMYQATNAWNGMIDPDGTHTARYDIIEQMFAELSALRPVIQSMTRVANIATASGGGGGDGAYASADVTTHVDHETGDLYLVVVNHDVEDAADVTITIDADAVGAPISSVSDAASGTAVTAVRSGSQLVIADLPFAPGEGRIVKLSTSAPDLVGEDADFTVTGTATAEAADTSAGDGSTALEPVATGGTARNVRWNWDAQDLEPGVSYDVYADVKVRFAHDITYDANDYPTIFRPSSPALTLGIYDGTAGAAVTSPVSVTGSALENQLWRTVKVGTFTPSPTADEYVYVASTGNAADYATIHVDRFTFVKTPTP
ncbi:FlgD immunoglobulin-like domain containing protein [Microbacterium sp. W4I20]|uniref:FlgD immunoglobulin-like domain containing protein n=1 Tax=Microbacterium sp. W4I20 TaxID=3042262 RepID=UPI002781A9F0|nr:FlgD immunoglobulin-like domain containing protein [Microbacterium sp. W4I20]MDQ0727605.1 hypothetical protein [Microbacterium sp. W4I20]